MNLTLSFMVVDDDEPEDDALVDITISALLTPNDAKLFNFDKFRSDVYHAIEVALSNQGITPGKVYDIS